MISKRHMYVALILVGAVSLSGCADLKNKFVRKKKEAPRAQRYYAVKTYHVTPSLDLYTKRYVLWKNWQSELEAVLLSENQKKPKMAADQALSNLIDMRNMLVPEKGDQLQKYVDDMIDVERTIRTQGVTGGNQTQLQKRIEIIGFDVQRKFSYNDMKNYIADDFQGGPAPEPSVPAPGTTAQEPVQPQAQEPGQPQTAEN